MPKAEKSCRWNLEGMTALVTGGTKGIGHAIVEELAGFGARVHTCARGEAELNKCICEWQRKDFQVGGSVSDVSSRVEREKLMQTVSSLFDGKLNILINNVGTTYVKPTIDYTAEDFSFHISTNLESAYHLCQLSHPFLKASGSGSIVFISSNAGVVSCGSVSLYSVTKGAMNQLARNLACEWASNNIRANSVAPGITATPLGETMWYSVSPSRQLQKYCIAKNTIGPGWKAGGGRIIGRLSVYARGFLHNRTDHCDRWRTHHQWLLLPNRLNSF